MGSTNFHGKLVSWSSYFEVISVMILSLARLGPHKWKHLCSEDFLGSSDSIQACFYRGLDTARLKRFAEERRKILVALTWTPSLLKSEAPPSLSRLLSKLLGDKQNQPPKNDNTVLSKTDDVSLAFDPILVSTRCKGITFAQQLKEPNVSDDHSTGVWIAQSSVEGSDR
jgi:hypothetical protein